MRTPASARRPLVPGDVLEGKWRLEELLGAGGMGQVYRARDVALERDVAVKLLHDALCEDPESVARFEREARAMARLEHPHITPIHAVGRQEGRPFIVMKHLEGMSLARYLRSLPGPLPLPEVMALARQLCAGLAFIHQRGCVHRDIKPGNIFLSPSGHATLLDFGILWEHRGADSTRSGVRLGTPSYMAPEQARGETVDGRADLYSLGLVLLEVSAGLPPSVTCRLLGEGAVKAIREQAPWLSASFAEVLVKATALNPEQRFDGAPALLDALEEAVQPGAVVPAPEAAPAPRAKRASRGAMAVMGAAAAGVLALGVVAPWRVGETVVGHATEAPVGTSTAPSTAHASPATSAAAQETARPAAGMSPSTGASTAMQGTPPSAGTSTAAQDTSLAAAGTLPSAGTSTATQDNLRSASDSAAPATTPETSPGSSAVALAPQSGPAASTRSPAPPAPSATPVATGRPAARAASRAAQPATGRRSSSTQGRGELRVVTLHAGKAVWANVLVDGKHHGATPVSLDLPAGRHSLRVERSGYAPQKREVEVSPGSREVVRIELHE